MGKLILKSKHRLLCGDCRESQAWERLLGGERVNVCMTSPPYASQRKYDESSGFKPIPPDEYVAWWEPLQACVRQHLAADGSFFVNIKPHCEDGERVLYVFDLVLKMRRGWGWRFVDEFCWRNTRNGVPGEWGNRLKNAFEPIYHFSTSERVKLCHDNIKHESDGVMEYAESKPYTKPNATGSGFEHGHIVKHGMALPSNVIELAPSQGKEHSAAFPIGLPSFFIRAFSDEGDVILDPFMGSGTSIMAAEALNRQARGIEISPMYCDVICKRYAAKTGLAIVRESDGAEFPKPEPIV
jgi:site-specific DNA-methyltransferase (adenine-specific)